MLRQLLESLRAQGDADFHRLAGLSVRHHIRAGLAVPHRHGGAVAIVEVESLGGGGAEAGACDAGRGRLRSE